MPNIVPARAPVATQKSAPGALSSAPAAAANLTSPQPSTSRFATKRPARAKSASNAPGTAAPSEGWSSDYPEGASYVWQRTVKTYGDGRTETSTPVLVDWPRESNARETVYAHSTTGPTTAAKNATIDSGTLELTEGAVVSVTFTYANTASSPSLNVGGKGSKPIRTNGTPYAYWSAGATVLFVYDGTYWQVASSLQYCRE